MKKLRITQTRSGIGNPEKQRKIIRGLGLKKIGHAVIREDCPEIRGMVKKIRHLVKIEETENG